jgi:hypothetical protein
MIAKKEIWSLQTWKVAIGRFWLLKQEMRKQDREGLWDYDLPALACSESEIVAAEKRLGEPIDAQYRNFLLVAGGWRSFWHSVDIFGPADLGDGPAFKKTESDLSVLEENGIVAAQSVYPIGASTDDLDVVVLERQGSDDAGTVIWLAGQEIDRYEGFQDFFLAMFEYSKRDLADFSRTGA